MKFGINEETYIKIKETLSKFPYEFIIFGSRARGDYKKESDIDFAILEKVSREEQYNIKNELDKLDIIYTIDIVFVDDNTKIELINSIKKEGKEF